MSTRLEIREGYADVGDQTLHYVEAGDGPLLVLLHGFPEFWFGWRLQIEPLAAAGFRVVAPDTRHDDPGLRSRLPATTLLAHATQQPERPTVRASSRSCCASFAAATSR